MEGMWNPQLFRRLRLEHPKWVVIDLPQSEGDVTARPDRSQQKSAQFCLALLLPCKAKSLKAELCKGNTGQGMLCALDPTTVKVVGRALCGRAPCACSLHASKNVCAFFKTFGKT